MAAPIGSDRINAGEYHTQFSYWNKKFYRWRRHGGWPDNPHAIPLGANPDKVFGGNAHPTSPYVDDGVMKPDIAGAPIPHGAPHYDMQQHFNTVRTHFATFPEGWTFRRVLGVGGEGMAMHWRYTDASGTLQDAVMKIDKRWRSIGLRRERRSLYASLTRTAACRSSKSVQDGGLTMEANRDSEEQHTRFRCSTYIDHRY